MLQWRQQYWRQLEGCLKSANWLDLTEIAAHTTDAARSLCSTADPPDLRLSRVSRHNRREPSERPRRFSTPPSSSLASQQHHHHHHQHHCHRSRLAFAVHAAAVPTSAAGMHARYFGTARCVVHKARVRELKFKCIDVC